MKHDKVPVGRFFPDAGRKKAGWSVLSCGVLLSRLWSSAKHNRSGLFFTDFLALMLQWRLHHLDGLSNGSEYLCEFQSKWIVQAGLVSAAFFTEWLSFTLESTVHQGLQIWDLHCDKGCASDFTFCWSYLSGQSSRSFMIIILWALQSVN